MGQDGHQFRVRALVNNLELIAPVGVSVTSTLSGSIGSIAASGSGGGTAAINGSVTTNTIDATVLAQVTNVNQSNASSRAMSVHATNSEAISSLAGTISGGGTAGVGVAISVNDIGGSVTARAANSTLKTTGAVDLQASSSGTIRSVAAGVAGGGTVGAAGSNTTNGITSTVLAQLDTVTQTAAASSLQVLALDSSTIQSFAGTVTGGGTAAGGAAFALNFLGRTATNADSSKSVTAEVVNSAVNASGAVLVKARSTSLIESMGVAVGGSGSAAVTGSNTTNLLEDNIVANWSGGSLNGGASSLTVQAQDAATVHTLAGNMSASGAAAVGAAIAVNQVSSAVQSTLSGMTLNAATSVTVNATPGAGTSRGVAAFHADPSVPPSPRAPAISRCSRPIASAIR
jgi:hypothetical protein